MKNPSFIRIAYTAAADTAFRVCDVEKWLYFADVFVITADAYMGTVYTQDVPIYANDIYTFPTPVNLNELYFRNLGAGVNTTIVITGIEICDKDLIKLFQKGVMGNI